MSTLCPMPIQTRPFYLMRTPGGRPAVVTHEPEPFRYVAGPFKTRADAGEALADLRRQRVNRLLKWTSGIALVVVVVVAVVSE